jgi:ribosomal protein S18 acetylase RimI-like enzyme
MSVRLILSDFAESWLRVGEGGGVGDQGWHDCLRPATADDESFLYAVFCTTWEHEVSAMPNPSLVQHYLRIQYTAQPRRFAQRFPGHERWVVTYAGQPAGRFFMHRSPSILHVVEITLLPEYRSRGIGSSLLRGVMDEAAAAGQSVSLRVARRNVRAANLYNAVGFRLVTMDDQDSYFEWTPQLTQHS